MSTKNLRNADLTSAITVRTVLGALDALDALVAARFAGAVSIDVRSLDALLAFLRREIGAEFVATWNAIAFDALGARFRIVVERVDDVRLVFERGSE